MSILKDMKVLDLSKIIAGPTTAMILGDLGADVIKIEEPEKGDESRLFPPFQNNVSAFFMACNRNKRALSLNLKSTEGKKVFKELVKEADIVIESFRTGVADKLGIDYKTLQKINPKLIYCSISGFGRSGPKANSGGYDALAQAYGGLMSVTGLGEGYPPVRAGYSVSDITTGFNATIAILVALLKRKETGEGSSVEASLLQTQVGLMSYYATMFQATKKNPTPIGSRHPNFAPYQAFKTKDGYILLGISNEKLWDKFCSLPLFSHLKDEKEFSVNALRIENLENLETAIQNITETMTKEDLISILEEAKIPCSPINTIEEVVKDEQVNYNSMIVDMEHPVAGVFKSSNSPFKVNGLDFTFNKYPPEKGEHNLEILTEIGISESDIAEFQKNNII